MDSPDTSRKRSKKKAPSPRRDGREAALQYLYRNDIQGEVDFSPEAFTEFWELRLAKEFAKEFAVEILRGIEANATEIDVAIRDRLENFAFQRLAAVDRNILRLGAFEILFSDHIPPEAAINEAIEIAKRFGTEETPAFVNGILDRIHKDKSASE